MIQTTLTEAMEVFSATVLKLLGSLTPSQLKQLGELASSGRLEVRSPQKPSAERRQPEVRKPPARISAVRRSAGTKPVPCPAPRCKAPGIRSKMNFCGKHADQLPKLEKIRLRELQRASHRVERIAIPA